MTEPLKVGDVVALRSCPEHRMTVVDDDYGDHTCAWVDDEGQPQSWTYPLDALVKAADAQHEKDAHEVITTLTSVNQQLASEATTANERAERLRSQLVGHLDDIRIALDIARQAYPELEAESMADAMRALANRYETIKREANEQIAALLARLGPEGAA